MTEDTARDDEDDDDDDLSFVAIKTVILHSTDASLELHFNLMK